MPVEKNKIKCNYKESILGSFCIDGHMGYFIQKKFYKNIFILDGNDTPCPLCNTRKFIVEYKETVFSGNSRQRRIALRKKIKSVRAWAEKRAKQSITQSS